MDAITPWLTPALVVAVYTALRVDIRGVNTRIDIAVRELRTDIAAVNTRIDGVNASVNARIDNAVRELRTDIAGVHARIDAVLLADRDRNRQSRGAA